MNNKFLKNEKACKKMLKYCPPSGVETGRSLTEMLGVLVIIGVLSITGILGYQFAMNKYRANLILGDVNVLATITMAQDLTRKMAINEQRTPEDLAVVTNPPTQYAIKKEAIDFFHIIAGRVPYGVCQIVVGQHPQYIEEIVANALTTGKCEKERDNDIYFYGNSNLDTNVDENRFERCSEDQPCDGSCYTCVRGICMDTDEKCPADQHCVRGECSVCEKGTAALTNGRCMSCQVHSINDALGAISAQECKKCADRFFFHGSMLGVHHNK